MQFTKYLPLIDGKTKKRGDLEKKEGDRKWLFSIIDEKYLETFLET